MTNQIANRICIPGTFNPATIAHLALADTAAVRLEGAVTFVLTRRTLGKDDASQPLVDTRAYDLEQLLLQRSSTHAVAITEASLLVDIACGYDWLVLGADKWIQILEPHWYGSDVARDAAIAALPSVAVVPRAGITLPSNRDAGKEIFVMSIDESFAEVSSTEVRRGRRDWQA